MVFCIWDTQSHSMQNRPQQMDPHIMYTVSLSGLRQIRLWARTVACPPFADVRSCPPPLSLMPTLTRLLKWIKFHSLRFSGTGRIRCGTETLQSLPLCRSAPPAVKTAFAWEASVPLSRERRLGTRCVNRSLRSGTDGSFESKIKFQGRWRNESNKAVSMCAGLVWGLIYVPFLLFLHSFASLLFL